MDSVVFGSFSITSFIDLYQAHRSSWHDRCELFELYHNDNGEFEIITHAVDIEGFKRKYKTSYLIGVCTESGTTHGIDITVDTSNGVEICINEEFKERKKVKGYFLNVLNGKVEVSTSERNHIYIDDYLSISSIPLNNFDPIDPFVEYNLDISEVSWKSFGVAGGYGSRNKLKKIMYPQYKKASA